MTNAELRLLLGGCTVLALVGLVALGAARMRAEAAEFIQRD
jgi:hypothetical protein